MEIAPKTRELSFIAPDGINYTIREQNGNDDDVLSTLGDAQQNKSIDKFLAGIIIGPKRLSWEEIHTSMGVATKYYIVLKSRMFTHGNILLFKHTFQTGEQVEFEEDLSLYDRDLSKDEEVKETPGITPVRKYPNGASILRQLTIGNKKLLYKLQTSKAEAYMMNIPKENVSKNDELRARELTLIQDGREIKIENFRDFSASEMREIWKDIRANDVDFALVTKLQTADKKTTEYVSLLTITEFFFPM